MGRLLLSIVCVVMLGVPSSDGWAGEDPPTVSIAAEEGPCDWLAGGPHKMHWPQLPDLSPAGIDVSGMGTVLADDFMCTASGPISRIHFWGSFADDVLPTRGADALLFEVSIYLNVPAQQKRAEPAGHDPLDADLRAGRILDPDGP